MNESARVPVRSEAPAPVGSAVDFEQLFLSLLPLVESLVSFLRQRHRLSSAEAEDFASHVRLKLLEDDYQVLRKFQGRSSLKTYLTTVVQRLFLDQRIAQWGKWRPSQEAKRLGPLAMRLESLVTRDGLALDEAVETLRTNHGVVEDRTVLRDLFQRLPSRSPRRFVGEEEIEALATSGEVEAAVLDRERAPRARHLLSALNAALAGLPASDRVLLRLRFDEGLTVAEIQRSLKLDPGKLYRRFEALLATLRSALESQGFDGKEIGDLLEGESPLNGFAGSAGKTESRPSKGM